jgi:hypothetical protein
MQGEVAILKEKIERLEEKIMVLEEAETATHDMLMFCRDMEIALTLTGADFYKFRRGGSIGALAVNKNFKRQEDDFELKI